VGFFWFKKPNPEVSADKEKHSECLIHLHRSCACHPYWFVTKNTPDWHSRAV